MPVLFNKETGLAENLPDDAAAHAALAAGSHEIPLVSPTGDIGSAPHAEAPNLLASGYKQPSSEQLSQLINKAKHSSGLEQAKTFAEGAAEGATFGLSSGIEAQMYGNAPEQLARREATPGTHMAGQLTGLVGSSLLGIGEGAMLEKAGAAAVEHALPNAGASVAGRITQAAVKSGVENMLFQSGDEASKAMVGDPNQTAETALAGIGMSGLIGAGIGASIGGVSEAWKLLKGPKVAQGLEAMHASAPDAGSPPAPDAPMPGAADMPPEASLAPEEAAQVQQQLFNLQQAGGRVNLGPEASSGASEAAGKAASGAVPEDVIAASGVDVPESMKAALGEDAQSRWDWQTLQESESRAANEARKDLEKFHESVKENTAKALDLNPEDVPHLRDLSEGRAGKIAQDQLHKDLSDVVEPISAEWDELHERFQDTKLLADTQARLSDALFTMANEEGILKMPSSQAYAIIKRVMNEMPLQETAGDLIKYISNIVAETDKPELWHLGKLLKKTLRGELNTVIETRLKTMGPGWVERYANANKEYSAMTDMLEDLNTRLRLGNFSGPKDFLNRLKAERPEKILKGLNFKNDVKLQERLRFQFPELYNTVREYSLKDIARDSLNKTRDAIDIKRLQTKLADLTPEYRNSILPPGADGKINAISQLVRSVPEKMNNSGTAKTWFALAKQGALGSVIDMLPGGKAGRAMVEHFQTEGADATRLAMLKAKASGAPPSPTAFKAAVDYAKAVIKGENMLSKATKAVFTAGKEVLAEPTERDREKLKKQIDLAVTDPSKLMEVGGDLGHYMPDHAAGLSSAAARNLQYLASLRPNTAPMGPLDPERKPSSTEEAQYNRALDIAIAPTMLLKGVKAGTLTLQDLQHGHAMYPGLMGKMQDKLMHGLMDHKERKLMPYKTKLGLSMFMGQPLDASMQPESIRASMSMGPVPGQHTPMQAPAGQPSRKSPSLTKLPGLSGTTQERRVQDRQTKW